MVSEITFKCLIHFEFILVCGVRRWSSFISFHVSVPCSQDHLLNKLSLAHCMCLLPLSNINRLKGMGLFLGSLFCPNDLCFCMYASTMLFWLIWFYNLILGSMIPPTSFFFLRIAIAMWGLLWFHINFWNVCSSSVEYVIGIWIGIALNLKIACGSMDMLVMLILHLHEHCICFHLFISSSVSFFSVLKFSECRPFIFLVRFIPMYFVLFEAVVNGIVFLISLSVSSLLAYKMELIPGY